MGQNRYEKLLCVLIAVIVAFTSFGFCYADAAPDLITQIYEKNYNELDIIQKAAFDNSLLSLKPKLVTDPVGQLSTAYLIMVNNSVEPKAQVAFTAWAAKQHPESVTLLNNLGFALFSIKDYGNSVEVLKLALKAEPESLETMVNLGNVYLDTDKDDEAKAEYEKVLAIDKEHVKAWEGLYGYYMKKKDFQKAIEVITKIKPPGFVQNGKQELQAAVDAALTTKKLVAVQDGEDIDSSQQKINKMTEMKPINLASVVEDISPELAEKIRNEMESLKVSVKVPAKPFLFDYSDLEKYTIYSSAYSGEDAATQQATTPNIDPSIYELGKKIDGLSESEIQSMVDQYVGDMKSLMEKYQNINMNDIAEVTKAMKEIKLTSGRDMFEKLKPQGEKASTMQLLGMEETKGTVTSSNYSNYKAHRKDIISHFKNLVTKFDEERESMKDRFEADMKKLIDSQAGHHDNGPQECATCIGQRNALREKYLEEFGAYTDRFYNKYVRESIEKSENSQALYIKNMGNSKLKNMEGEQFKAELNAFLSFFAKAEAPIDGFEPVGSEARRQLQEKIEQVRAQAKNDGEALPPLQEYEKNQRSMLEKVYEDVKFEGAAGLAKVKYENAEITLALNDPFTQRYMDFSASLKDMSVSMTEGKGCEVAFKVAQKGLIGDEGLEAKVGYSNRGVGQKTTLYFDDSLNVADARITPVSAANGVSTEVSLFDVGVEGSAKIETTAEGTSSFVSGIKVSAKDFQIWEKQYQEQLNQ